MESTQAKWEEMFGTKDEGKGMKDEEPKVKKPRKKAITKKSATKEKTAADRKVKGETSPRKKTTK